MERRMQKRLSFWIHIPFLLFLRIQGFAPAELSLRRLPTIISRPLYDKKDYGADEWNAESDWEKSSNSWEDDSQDTIDKLSQLQSEEMDFLKQEAKRDARVADMRSQGFSEEAIAAYTGYSTVEEEENEVLDQFMDLTSSGPAAFGQVVENIDYTKTSSHQHVEVDKATGEPLFQERFVYVDEYTCIGCTHCATVAKNTFFMEDDYGRARVFLQGGDDEQTVKTAVECCPVDCIHYVPWNELKSLEIERSGVTEINYKARLVGGDGARLSKSGGGMQKISGNSGFRCNNCPSFGCAKCPMYGVGENPAYKERKEKKNAARKKRLEEERKKQNSKRFDL